MIKKFITTAILLTATCTFTSTAANAYTNNANKNIIKTPVSTFNKENLKFIKNNELTNDFLRIITFSQNTDNKISQTAEKINYSKKYAEANDKFAQGNITAAYKDYKDVVSASADNDFVSLGLAYKFANIGLFSLAQEAINNIQDRETYNHQIQLIKSKLFPQVVLSYDDEIQLAQNYTEIYYNNLAFEVARDMGKLPDRYKRSDYAHYILSQAYYNIKEYSKAINEINRALSINPDNINYLKYKAQIFCETNRLSDAVKILNSMLEQDVNILDYRNDLEGLYYYTLAKATKDREKSGFYLAQYFMKAGDYQRAIKELNQNISADKKDYKSMTLLADIYFKQNKLSDAMDLYEKAYKIKKNDPENLMGIANMYMYKKDYKNALDFYVKASKKDKNNKEAMINASLCYKMLGATDKSVEYINKVFAKGTADAKIYYTASKIDDIKNIQYLKKSVSLDPLMVDAWLDLADIAIKNNRIALAQNYLLPVNYLNKRNDRYYYYMGLINKQQGLKEAAQKNFRKSLELNPANEYASKELNSQL